MRLMTFALCAGMWWMGMGTSMAQAPEKVVKQFFTAIQKGDFEKAKKYGDDNTDRLMDVMKMMAEQLSEEAKTTKTVGKISNVDCEIDGDKGLCNACCNAEGNPLSDVMVEKVDGKWLVVMNKEDMNKEDQPPMMDEREGEDGE